MSDPTAPPAAPSAAPLPWSWREERAAGGLLARAALPEAPRHPPLLLLHGIAVGPWCWERWQGFLAARGWPSYALALRGRAGSRPVSDLGRVTLADYVEDARAMAAALGRPLVVGHSMGGLLAQVLAADGAVDAAVLLTSMPPKGIGFATTGLLLRQLRHLPAMVRQRPMVARAADLAAMTLNRVPAAERPALAARFEAESGRVSRDLSLGGLAVDAARVRCPMLAVSAEDDHFFGPRVARQLAARYHIPHWHYHGHAHFLLVEPGWETVAADVERWLAHLPARAARAAAYDRLWAALQGRIGEAVELELLDGRRVVAELVNVDLARHRDVLFEVRETLAPGAGGMVRPPAGEIERVELHEVVAMRGPGAEAVTVAGSA